MKFHDYLIASGRLAHEHLHDTAGLERQAVALTTMILQGLRSGTTRRNHGVEGLPPFDIALGTGLTDQVEDAPLAARMRAPGRFFSLFAPGAALPWSINLVLPDLPLDRPRSAQDQRAVATLVGLSRPDVHAIAHATALMDRLWRHRPFLATVLTGQLAPLDTIRIGADFATCFAASILEQPT